MSSIKSYHVKHSLDIRNLLENAKLVADYAVANKNNKKILTSKYVKEYGLPSVISNQILRKYGRGSIKEAKNVNLIIPNSNKFAYTLKNGTVKIRSDIDYSNGKVYLKPLNICFRWNPGKTFERINQVEISENKFMISATFKNQAVNQEYANVLGIDLNCGVGRSIANCANLKNGEILNLGKQGPNIRKEYFSKRRIHKISSDKEKRRTRDLDHKISRTIVNYALKHKLKIVVEDLSGIRKTSTKGNGSKNKNRFVNSWSFYRLQQFIEYKAKEHGIPFEKINPQYTSQECNYCSVLGIRKGDTFQCKNRKCKVYRKERHADINAAFNIGKRSLSMGGRAQ